MARRYERYNKLPAESVQIDELRTSDGAILDPQDDILDVVSDMEAITGVLGRLVASPAHKYCPRYSLDDVHSDTDCVPTPGGWHGARAEQGQSLGRWQGEQSLGRGQVTTALRGFASFSGDIATMFGSEADFAPALRSKP